MDIYPVALCAVRVEAGKATTYNGAILIEAVSQCQAEAIGLELAKTLWPETNGFGFWNSSAGSTQIYRPHEHSSLTLGESVCKGSFNVASGDRP